MNVALNYILNRGGQVVYISSRKLSSTIESKIVKAKKYILHQHFSGLPKQSDLKLVEEKLPNLRNGEFLSEAVYLSVDPYMRAYEPRLKLGTVFIGSQIAKITDSKSKQYPIGKYVVGQFGWRSHTITSEEEAKNPELLVNVLPDFGKLSLSLGLGVLGMPGNAAYFGFLEICKPKEGETVVVSGAAGAVGSVVGQIAKIKGCNVIGIAGDDEKGKWLINELGFDHFINYKKPNLHKTLAKCAPNGVDCYFDNVGGEISSTVLSQMNLHGRVSVCGAIVGYNANRSTLPTATITQGFIAIKQLRIEGFIATRWRDRWMEGIDQNLKWISEGKLKYRETVTEGFENTFQAFVDMLQGGNVGKAVVKV
ncbi:hypothetical protein ILUMI_05996 [Ignelater luminosus]|uniref:Prostaglandin reductase 1 n=1 Tax=Ignelater luminosus TaxID=2038154 RepID=A0A8K0DB84_IGNLU|nr:hypothetical protein ILUMI_05996 [Ignelater luminosus]